MNHKSGYVTILGLPNAGKSTLLNSLLGQKLAITNLKPQTTRKKIAGILSKENYQIIFLDTPGLLSPAYLLQEKMMSAVEASISGADLLLVLIDVKKDPFGKNTLSHNLINQKIPEYRDRIILLLNKIDLIPQDVTVKLIEHFEKLNIFNRVIPVSALSQFNLESLLDAVVEKLPEGPAYYPEDIIADENDRFFVSEIIREKILDQFREEVPYSVEVLIAEFKEREKGKFFLSAEIVVERDSQKAIVIGKNGVSIKKLGEKSRQAIEEFLQHEVYLDLRVKVRKNWRSDENMLNTFGYGKDSG
jgi:GTP-binding protein Era